MAQAAKPRTTGLDLILIGKTGNGKSSTGNFILRRANIFKPSYNTTSGTKIPQFEWTIFEGRILQVVDSPGVLDTCEDEERGITLVHDALQKAMLANPTGYHAFLVVLKFASRFTKEEQTTVEILKGILGKNFLKDYGIIVMTNGDTFEHDCQKNKTLNLQRFCQDQKGPFKSILKECSNRIVVFNNMTVDEDVKYKQVKQLIDMVDKLKNQRRRYTNEHFAKADQFYQHFMVKISGTVVTKEVLQEQSLIMHAINSCEILSNEEEKIESLKCLLIRNEKLINCLKETDKGTGALKEFITNATNTKHLLDARIALQADFIQKLKSIKMMEDKQIHDFERQEKQLREEEHKTEENRKKLQWEATLSFFEKIDFVVKAFGNFLIGTATAVTQFLKNQI
ncbi:GTPase IMAP family member 9-like isoform X2 [Physella acuta]|uniref:GTPase IMAP family member 9-like isoform X2 n=1 Tax=Physella acuta TaxID=109671 RepID=UPI0027DC8DB4|nr:GTPase IMAP family member 9-like isoform X2 [Physella acuta]